MKYIRTKDGIFECIWKITEINGKSYINEEYDGILHREEIIKQADTIEELIMPGDLVRYEWIYMSWIEKNRGDEIRGIDMHLIDRESVCDLWIPIGNDPETYPDFKLVASKRKDDEKLCLIQ